MLKFQLGSVRARFWTLGLIIFIVLFSTLNSLENIVLAQVLPPVSNNPNISNSTKFNDIFNDPKNLICYPPSFAGGECYPLAIVNYESNQTVVLSTYNPNYLGATIDIMKEQGFLVDEIISPNIENAYLVVTLSKE